MVAIGFLLLAAVVVGVVNSERNTHEVTAPAQSEDSHSVGIDLAVVTPDGLTVTGWIRGTTPQQIVVESSDGTVVNAGVAGRRFDREAAFGETYWAFQVAMVTSGDPSVVCASVGPDSDCFWIGCVGKVFNKSFRRALRDEYGGQRFTAHIIDTRTGCEYDLNADMAITTASVIKVEILGGLLLQAQRENRELTTRERDDAEAMMQFSLNPETGRLYGQVGGMGGMRALDDLFGATNTLHTSLFGATWSTAKDQTMVSLGVLAGSGPLNAMSIETAQDIMSGIHPAQSWGISAGVPADYKVWNKNGFYPYTGYGWRIGSTGFVAAPGGGGYAITVMTDNNQTQRDGLLLVEDITRHVAKHLTHGPAANRSFDELRCITHQSGGTWTSLALELGLPSSQANAVRFAAGGDGPLRGQLVCEPRIQ